MYQNTVHNGDELASTWSRSFFSQQYYHFDINMYILHMYIYIYIHVKLYVDTVNWLFIATTGYQVSHLVFLIQNRFGSPGGKTWEDVGRLASDARRNCHVVRTMCS